MPQAVAFAMTSEGEGDGPSPSNLHRVSGAVQPRKLHHAVCQATHPLAALQQGR